MRTERNVKGTATAGESVFRTGCGIARLQPLLVVGLGRVPQSEILPRYVKNLFTYSRSCDLISLTVEAKAEKTEKTMTYDEALEKSRAASREFAKAQTDYRAGKTDPTTFLIAKKKHDAAMDEFEVAYAAEQAKGA